MKPIVLTEHGEELTQSPLEDARDDGSSFRTNAGPVGVHARCGGWMDASVVSAAHFAIGCRKCFLRVVVPAQSIVTYGDLRRYFSRVQEPAPDTVCTVVTRGTVCLRPLPCFLESHYRCGDCATCALDRQTCICDGALDEGCYLCTPDKHTRPECPRLCVRCGTPYNTNGKCMHNDLYGTCPGVRAEWKPQPKVLGG